jgi:uncharacterized membrane protein
MEIREKRKITRIKHDNVKWRAGMKLCENNDKMRLWMTCENLSKK